MSQKQFISQINYLTRLYGQLTNLFDKKKYFFADMHDTSFVISLNILLYVFITKVQ